MSLPLLLINFLTTKLTNVSKEAEFELMQKYEVFEFTYYLLRKMNRRKNTCVKY